MRTLFSPFSSSPSPSLRDTPTPPSTRPWINQMPPSRFSVSRPVNCPTPFMEQLPMFAIGYPNTFYADHHMREFQGALEKIKHLEIEIAKLEVERDTLRDVLNRQGSIIGLVLSVARPTRESHPHIRFWTVQDYEKWLDSSEAQIGSRGKEAYLEEEDGAPVNASKVTAIRARIRTAWAELVDTKCAPQVWGELDITAREKFHSFIERAYPLFKCAQGGWKLDRLARTSYPAWKRGHVDGNGNWISKADKKRKRRAHKSEELDSSHPRKKLAVSKDTNVDSASLLEPRNGPKSSEVTSEASGSGSVSLDRVLNASFIE